jgi:phosphatidylcholine synthase
VFARRDMKTEDGYFRGFPALWNIVALYLFAAQPGPVAAAATIVLLAALSFSPIHVVHPFRVRGYGWLLPTLAVGWAGCTVGLLLATPGSPVGDGLLVGSLTIAAILGALGFLRTIRGPA